MFDVKRMPPFLLSLVGTSLFGCAGAPAPEAVAPTPEQVLAAEAKSEASESADAAVVASGAAPAETLDLSSWKLTLPELDPGRGKAREVKEEMLNGTNGAKAYVHERWFFVDEESKAIVFKTPNHLATTKNSKNTRSELREMVRAGDTNIDTKSPGNNWVISTHPQAADYGAIGGKLSAKLAVDWVSTSGDENKFSAHSVVVGQIHGSGKTEPLKIFYRKLPGHKLGSLFWNYEIRPENQDDRTDVPNDVWGSHLLKGADAEPKDGIALGEEFSYVVDVAGTVMTLTFTKKDGTEKKAVHDLSKGHASHSIDRGYSDDWMYFKAGAYNQCNLGTEGIWGSSCDNRGEKEGDYTQVRFFALDVSH